MSRGRDNSDHIYDRPATGVTSEQTPNIVIQNKKSPKCLYLLVFLQLCLILGLGHIFYRVSIRPTFRLSVDAGHVEDPISLFNAAISKGREAFAAIPEISAPGGINSTFYNTVLRVFDELVHNARDHLEEGHHQQGTNITKRDGRYEYEQGFVPESYDGTGSRTFNETAKEAGTRSLSGQEIPEDGLGVPGERPDRGHPQSSAGPRHDINSSGNEESSSSGSSPCAMEDDCRGRRSPSERYGVIPGVDSTVPQAVFSQRGQVTNDLSFGLSFVDFDFSTFELLEKRVLHVIRSAMTFPSTIVNFKGYHKEMGNPSYRLLEAFTRRFELYAQRTSRFRAIYDTMLDEPMREDLTVDKRDETSPKNAEELWITKKVKDPYLNYLIGYDPAGNPFKTWGQVITQFPIPDCDYDDSTCNSEAFRRKELENLARAYAQVPTVTGYNSLVDLLETLTAKVQPPTPFEPEENSTETTTRDPWFGCGLDAWTCPGWYVTKALKAYFDSQNTTTTTEEPDPYAGCEQWGPPTCPPWYKAQRELMKQKRDTQRPGNEATDQENGSSTPAAGQLPPQHLDLGRGKGKVRDYHQRYDFQSGLIDGIEDDGYTVNTPFPSPFEEEGSRSTRSAEAETNEFQSSKVMPVPQPLLGAAAVGIRLIGLVVSVFSGLSYLGLFSKGDASEQIRAAIKNKVIEDAEVPYIPKQSEEGIYFRTPHSHSDILKHYVEHAELALRQMEESVKFSRGVNKNDSGFLNYYDNFIKRRIGHVYVSALYAHTQTIVSTLDMYLDYGDSLISGFEAALVGDTSMTLFPPDAVFHSLTKLDNTKPKNFELIFENEYRNLARFYSLKSRILPHETKRHSFTIVVLVPMLNLLETYALYKYENSPVILGPDKLMLEVVPEESLVTSNKARTFSVTVSAGELSQCHRIGTKYLCPDLRLFKKAPTCIGALLKGTNQDMYRLCRFRFKKRSGTTVVRCGYNEYWFNTDNHRSIHLSCEDYGGKKTIPIKPGTTKVALPPTCTASIDDVLISPSGFLSAGDSKFGSEFYNYPIDGSTEKLYKALKERYPLVDFSKSGRAAIAKQLIDGGYPLDLADIGTKIEIKSSGRTGPFIGGILFVLLLIVLCFLGAGFIHHRAVHRRRRRRLKRPPDIPSEPTRLAPILSASRDDLDELPHPSSPTTSILQTATLTEISPPMSRRPELAGAKPTAITPVIAQLNQPGNTVFHQLLVHEGREESREPIKVTNLDEC